MNRLIKRILVWTAGSIVVVTIGLPFAAYFVLHEMPFMGTTFTPADWAQAGSCKGLTDWQCESKWMRCERGSMVRSLMRNHLIVGKTSNAETDTLLGKADRNFIRDKDYCATYPLGYCSGLGVDYDNLEICFDQTGVLRSKRHYQS